MQSARTRPDARHYRSRTRGIHVDQCGHTGHQEGVEPDDVVGTTLFLTSDDSHFVTGQTLYADGGFVYP